MQGVKLMYLEGEVKSGCVTGRTVLVIETDHQIDPIRAAGKGVFNLSISSG